MKKLINKLLQPFNILLYPNYDVVNSVHSQIDIFRTGFFQKILGFNRKTPWPVHWSSTVMSPDKISPGTRTPGLSKQCHVDGRNQIVFGKNVWIGPGAKIISMNHDLNNYELYSKVKPIYISDNCWIGASAIILPEVILGKHTIVAAGAVVTKSFKEGNQILGGNPAKVIKKLGEYEE